MSRRSKWASPKPKPPYKFPVDETAVRTLGSRRAGDWENGVNGQVISASVISLRGRRGKTRSWYGFGESRENGPPVRYRDCDA